MLAHYDCVIVGAGHGGSQAAVSLRQGGFSGSIGLISAESELPYERPPLSKDYLSGHKPFDQMLLRRASSWVDRKVDLLLNRLVDRLAADERSVSFSNGETLHYNHLIWAAGGRARRLGCVAAALRGVHSIRTRADVDALRTDLVQCQQIVIVGGGYIGLEAAAVFSEMGKKVVLLEAMERVLARVAGETVSRFYEAEHRRHGVIIRLSASVVEADEQDGQISAVRLSSGEWLPAQMLIVAVGIEPEIEPLRAAGATALNGVLVDSFCRTSLSEVYAVGDCALHVSEFAAGAQVRIESVQNAHDQAQVAAKAILGMPVPYKSIPWFWSKQYDLHLQTVGLSVGWDQSVVRGAISDRSFSVVYLRGGRIAALDCVNAPKDYVAGRSLVGTVLPDEVRMKLASSTTIKEAFS